jgi:hypothetical protein
MYQSRNSNTHEPVMAFSLFGVLLITFIVFLLIAGLARITLGD